MSQDALFRTIAVAAAAALLVAPYYGVIVEKLAEAAKAAADHGALLGRLAAAGLIVAAAWDIVPIPSLPTVAPAVTIDVEEPSVKMQEQVEPVAKALAGLPATDRQLWAATWAKAATVVEAEGTTTQQAFTDTAALRLFTTVALDIAWRRLGDHRPGSVAGLREAVEAVMASSIGLDAAAVTPAVRARYVEAANAIAWAGIKG